MKYFRISVSGKTFDVDVEEFSSAETRANSLPVASAKGTLIGPVLSKQQHSALKDGLLVPEEPVKAAQPISKTANETVSLPDLAPSISAEEGKSVTVPMPGKIVSVQIKPGQTVAAGQELMVMEAMKMMNPILAPADGVVKEIFVKAGDAVQTGMVVMIFE